MPKPSKSFYVITYDIGNEKRLRKVHDFLKDYGTWVQKSVFELFLSQSELAQVEDWLANFIDHNRDQVRVYGVCDRCLKQRHFLGKPTTLLKPGKYLIV